jgi:hypothetical protein
VTALGATTGPALLGVRHHGPGSARSVVAALDELRPDVVLVELPADVEGVLGWVGDPRLRPPVALLAHVVDEPRRAVFSPLAEFSPEWQALRWAARHGVPAVPIDLPHAITLAADVAGRADDDPGIDPIGALAAAAGEPDAERWWDDVVEHRGDGPPAFAVIADAMAAVRQGVDPGPRDARREAHMRQAIRRAAKRHERVAVVCGAWHVPALDPTGTTASADRTMLQGLAKVKVAISWVPWSHPRLARSSGYAAGVNHPGWYAHLFRHPGPEAATRFLVAAARAVRDEGLSASPEHVIAAVRLTEALAVLRGRPRPGLDDVLDATDAVIGGLPLVRDRLAVGHEVGSLPDGAPQAPLARDLATAQRRARLTPSAEARTVELDLRTPAGRARSVLLHRCVALDLGWAAVVDGRGSSGTFRETWRLTWRPELAVRLVELSPYGTTLEQAATARLVERCDGADLVAHASALDLAILAELPDATGPILERLARRSAVDPDTVHLIDALGPLARSARYGDARASDVAALGSVIDGLVDRIVAGLPAACASLDDEAAGTMAERLLQVQAALALLDHPTRRTDWPAVLDGLATERAHPVVQGRATRLLHDGGHWDAAAVSRRFARALSVGPAPTEAAAFLDGALAGSGTVLVHDRALLGLVDDWLSALPVDAFDRCLPVLRRTFGAFEPAERHRLGRLLTSSVVPEPAAPIDEPRAELALATVRTLLGLPAVAP